MDEEGAGGIMGLFKGLLGGKGDEEKKKKAPSGPIATPEVGHTRLDEDQPDFFAVSKKRAR